MTQPLVAKHGADWLAGGSADITFAQPAYEGELLSVRTAHADEANSHVLVCVNEQGVELARMSAQLHAAARAGEAFEVRAIPEEKWRRRGHEFIRLYVCILRGGRVVAEILHTAIFRPRKPA